MADTPALELRGITKRFGTLVANNAVDFELRRLELFVTKGFAATQIEVALSRALSVLSQVGNTGTSLSVKYSKDY